MPLPLIPIAIAGINAGVGLYNSYKQRKAMQDRNDRSRGVFEDAIKKVRANSGQNLYNQMMQSGTQRISRASNDAIQGAADRIGKDPGLLREVIADVTDRAGMSNVNLVGAAEQAKIGQDTANIDRENQLLEYMDRAERADTDAERERYANLIANLLGGTTSMIGDIYESGQNKSESDFLMSLIQSMRGTAGAGGGLNGAL